MECDPVEDPHEPQHSVTKSASAASNNTVMPELTLLLTGDRNSIEIGTKNILLDHDEQRNVEQFSAKLYDLCGRHISVINMLGLPNIDRVPLNQGIHAFLLLVPYGQHNSHYKSRVQLLEKTFGRGFLSYVMTVVTHESNEKCEGALADLKANSSFAEKRYHICTRTMTDEKEIVSLLEKIDVMVSENDHQSYSRLTCVQNKDQKEHLDHNSYKEERVGTEEEMEISTEVTSGPSETKGKGTVDVEKEIETLLSRLHLQDKLQQKLSPADFLIIGPPVKPSNDTCEKEVAYTFLQTLLALDYRARHILVKQESPEVSHPQSAPVSDSTDTDDSDLDEFFNTDEDSDQSKQTHAHPMDVQMAVFHCSDSFLKQDMVKKLSQCQYALPLLAPDPVTKDIECPLWTLRQIIKTWKVTEIKDKDTITMKSMPICKAETPMVSFFRLGSLSQSKSHLMNSLINDTHSTFFHRNCKGSTKSRYLMDGVAEIAWYFPAGNPNDSFTDCIAFCNLHGDALTTEKQREILIDKSSVNVVFVPTLGRTQKSTAVLSALHKSTKPLIILVADKDCGGVEKKPGKYIVGLKERSQSDVAEELKMIIKKTLSGPHTSFQLESMSKVSGVRVDEDDPVCQKGKSAAMKILNLLQGMDISKIKEKFLPCQGNLWHEWCRIKKELYHLQGNVEKEKCEKEQELTQIRQEQCFVSHTELMKSFTKSLLSLPSTHKEYFLKWMQILIDALSTDDLASILQRYDEKWSEVVSLKNKHDKSPLLDRKQNELEQISKKLQSATFGLEHIFREMGQIYEAHKSQKKQTHNRQTDWSKYPELAADLMISGRPMELMDGDAGYAPLTWISSVLEEVIRKLGDQTVFVLSVLGVQSSGKSTMLNAMFGLQFAVSAGRCTKGAFMQLIKVSEEIRNDLKLKFDYFLVVDTEGLRALELAGTTTTHHDNELSTFVVGLGNMTLINIFGENPAEMQDVLQIVVQAFMRMKKVKLSPSCVFVHQNVSDIGAAEKNMDGKRRLQEKLDDMAQLAAKEEDCDVKCFSDVISFDVQKDVKYFAQLWQGSPPMAPPNPRYSENVQELKHIILSKASQSSGITLSYLKSKIQDLWNALMNEQFVFSFKNTLEIAVYRKLEVKYATWTWTLRSNMLTIENQLYTRIENGKLDRVENSYLFTEMSKTFEEIKKDMNLYFEDKRDKDMLVQWRGRFEQKIKEFHEEQVKGVKKTLDEVIQQKKARKKLDDKKTEFENKLLQKSKELAHSLKDKAKEEELKSQFNTVWGELVRELSAGIKPIEDINMKEDQKSVLNELGFEWGLIKGCKDSNRYQVLSKVGHYSDYVNQKKQRDLSKERHQSHESKKENKDTGKQGTNVFKSAFNYFKQVTGISPTTQQKGNSDLSHEQHEQIRSFISQVEQQSLKKIQTKPVATRGYRSTYLLEMAQNVQTKVTEFESQKPYTLRKEFTVDLSLYVFDRAGRWLSQSHETYRKNNDALTYLESKKDQYYSIFRSFWKGNSSAAVFGEMICENLKVSAVQAVCNKTAIDLAGEMRCSFPAFSGNRLNLEKHVLKSLAEKEDFNGFITYIRDPRSQAENFIKDEVHKYMFREQSHKAQNILKKNVDDISEFVSQALFTATQEVKTQKGATDMWMEQFSSLLKDKLTLDTISCQNFRDINNFDFLKEEIEKGLGPIKTEMSRLSLDKMKDFRLQPDQILIDQLCRCCWVTCPFCAAVCTNTLEDHSPDDHNVPFHRSGSVNGWHYRNTVEMSVNFCTTNVASDNSFYPDGVSEVSVPFKQYRTAGPRFANWRITPDESKLTYWTWFVCRFQQELENYYGRKFEGKGEIPSQWRTHTKQQAIESLDEMYSE